MTQVIQGQQPGDPQKSDGPKYKLIRSTDLDRTKEQVGILISVLEEARTMAHVFLDSGQTYEVDPRVKEAAARTYESAALQLRNLLDEQPRWGPVDPEVEGFVEQLAQSNLEVAEAQKRLLLERTRPCFVIGATLHRIVVEGQPGWLAAVGKEPDPNSLVGLGLSPEQALRAFDVAYRKAEAQKPAEPDATPSPEPSAAPKKRAKKTKRNA